MIRLGELNEKNIAAHHIWYVNTHFGGKYVKRLDCFYLFSHISHTRFMVNSIYSQKASYIFTLTIAKFIRME